MGRDPHGRTERNMNGRETLNGKDTLNGRVARDGGDGRGGREGIETRNRHKGDHGPGGFR